MTHQQIALEDRPDKIIIYGHPGCPGVGPVRGMLRYAGATFEYVDIRQDAEAAARVRTINNGYESVPTLVFPDGSSLTEPSGGELKVRLQALGYQVGVLGWLIGNIWQLIAGGIIIFAVLRFLEII